MKEIITFDGSTVEVDTSKKAFEKAGFGEFHSGQKVLDHDGDICILEGLALGTHQQYETMVMWYRLINGKRSIYSASPADFEAI
ncbi:MAG: hypothetical protein PHG49_03770 [Candidatus Pacebacteria bacterium]|nr:hypothetical protein [Candidatus Paceibacterota bacterium]